MSCRLWSASVWLGMRCRHTDERSHGKAVRAMSPGHKEGTKEGVASARTPPAHPVYFPTIGAGIYIHGSRSHLWADLVLLSLVLLGPPALLERHQP